MEMAQWRLGAGDYVSHAVQHSDNAIIQEKRNRELNSFNNLFTVDDLIR